MDLSIIIITYNAKDITIQMLDSLKLSVEFIRNQSNVEVEVIVVDNDSTEDIADVINNDYKWVKLIRNSNEGFSKGNNRGVRAIDKTSKYVLFLNPDITLEESTIDYMYKYMNENNEVGLSTCKVDLWSGGLDWDCHRGFPTPWRAFCYFIGFEKLFGKIFPKTFGGYHLLDKNMDEVHEVDACLGAFMIMPREVGDNIEWWSEDYFLNGEDIDLCYRIKDSGKKITYVPQTSIVHYKGASKGTKKASKDVTKASDKTKSLQINSGIDAMEIFYRKYYEEKYPWIVNKIVFLGIWFLHKKRLLLGRE